MFSKHTRYIVLLAALVLLVPLGSFARSNNTAKVEIADNVLVGSTQLNAGTYQVKWEGSGPLLQVTFLESGKIVATTQARMVQINQKPEFDEITVSTKGNPGALKEIEFHGRKEALLFASN
jgi:hypothetical protein